MSQRDSGYKRITADKYFTPEWCTLALVPFLEPMTKIWEPAAGTGKMARALQTVGFLVIGTDINKGTDFLDTQKLPSRGIGAIVTNPPYTHAVEFIEHALELMKPVNGLVAMLLRCDFDHAKTRRHLFGDCRVFDKKIVLTKRIRWIEGSTGSPSFNHAWFLWDYKHRGEPTIAYHYE